MANLAIQISVALLTLMTLVLAIAAFFGFREARQSRERNQELKAELEKAAHMRIKLEERLNHLEADLKSMVFIAHLFHEGQTAYSKGDYDRAASYYEESLAMQPDNTEIQVRLARTLINKGQNGRADRLLRAVTSKDPNNTDAWRALSTSRRFSDHTEALRYMEKALELDASSVDNWNYLGLLLRDEGRYDEALAAHQEAQKLAPADPITTFFIALLNMKLQQKEAASYALYESYAQSEIRRKSGRIRPIWADTIEWAYRRNLDSPQEEDAAINIARRLKRTCIEERNLQTVLGHMTFFVYANNMDPNLDSTLAIFPAEEIKSILSRSPYKQALNSGDS
ncbi:MAG: tetratricopeptide repeat protein [Blastocatellia bacterium]|nr:tetratricopeptide repeat protein [Blastocatellia bacterium]